jgi:hypothetical protein
MTKQAQWWNEYDDGSECGSPNDEYMIYVNPEDTIFPGLNYVQGILKLPIEKARKWLRLDKGAERQLLLTPNMSSIGYSSAAVNDESDVEDCASSEYYLPSGHAAHSAINCYGKNILSWSTIGCLVASFALLSISVILIFTGKHKLRVEVDVGVSIGVVASLFSACTALGMTLYRRDPLPLLYSLMVWSTFAASCLLNVMLLVLLVGNTP